MAKTKNQLFEENEKWETERNERIHNFRLQRYATEARNKKRKTTTCAKPGHALTYNHTVKKQKVSASMANAFLAASSSSLSSANDMDDDLDDLGDADAAALQALLQSKVDCNARIQARISTQEFIEQLKVARDETRAQQADEPELLCDEPPELLCESRPHSTVFRIMEITKHT